MHKDKALLNSGITLNNNNRLVQKEKIMIENQHEKTRCSRMKAHDQNNL